MGSSNSKKKKEGKKTQEELAAVNDDKLDKIEDGADVEGDQADTNEQSSKGNKYMYEENGEENPEVAQTEEDNNGDAETASVDKVSGSASVCDEEVEIICNTEQTEESEPLPSNEEIPPEENPPEENPSENLDDNAEDNTSTKEEEAPAADSGNEKEGKDDN